MNVHAIRKVAIVTAAAMALIGAPTSGSRATDAGGGCVPSLVKYKTSDTQHDTTSQGPINVLGMATTITQGNVASGASCVIILFSGEASTDTNELMLVRATLDGNPCAIPLVFRSLSDGQRQTQAANFVCAAVGPGQHTARIQFFSSGGGHVTLFQRSMIVQYVK